MHIGSSELLRRTFLSFIIVMNSKATTHRFIRKTVTGDVSSLS